MKTLLASAAFVAAVAAVSPASAQTYSDGWSGPALGTFAQAEQTPLTTRQRRNVMRVRAQDGRVHSFNPSNDVYDTQGNYIGSDPDVFIRNELMRDIPERGD